MSGPNPDITSVQDGKQSNAAPDSGATPVLVEEVEAVERLVEKTVEKVEKVFTPASRPTSRPPVVSRNSSMHGPLYMQTAHKKIIVRSRKRKGDGQLRNLTRWLFENQSGTCHGPRRDGGDRFSRLPFTMMQIPAGQKLTVFRNRSLLQPHLAPIPHTFLLVQGPTIHVQVLRPFLLQPRDGEICRRPIRPLLHRLLYCPFHWPARQCHGACSCSPG